MQYSTRTIKISKKEEPVFYIKIRFIPFSTNLAGIYCKFVLLLFGNSIKYENKEGMKVNQKF